MWRPHAQQPTIGEARRNTAADDRDQPDECRDGNAHGDVWRSGDQHLCMKPIFAAASSPTRASGFRLRQLRPATISLAIARRRHRRRETIDHDCRERARGSRRKKHDPSRHQSEKARRVAGLRPAAAPSSSAPPSGESRPPRLTHSRTASRARAMREPHTRVRAAKGPRANQSEGPWRGWPRARLRERRPEAIAEERDSGVHGRCRTGVTSVLAYAMLHDC